jgi:molybdopterin molybdotransferase
VLAEQVIGSSVSAFDRAAMDGYALHGDETSGASDYNPLAFSVPARRCRGVLGAAVPAAVR